MEASNRRCVIGTRADFYVGKGKDAEWLGSIGWDGYPSGIDSAILHASDEAEYRAAVQEFFSKRNDVTYPADGWPWPWSDSQITDYAYTFAPESEGAEAGCVWYTIDSPDRWWKATEQEPDEDDDNYRDLIRDLDFAEHPDMSARKRVRWDHGSGLMVIKRRPTAPDDKE